ncbi:repressor LexA, partial [Candidatus Giovannonibacteria bacterium RIFCSPHIGHO2_01_FULL_45_24]
MLTYRQKQVKDFVEKTILRKSVVPSEREIAKHFHIAPSTVHEHLKEIEERGYLNRNPGKRRGISIRKNEGLIKIPLLGTIAAGEPIHVFEAHKETIAVPKSKIPSSSEVYALRVVGNSMIDENINNGDTVLIKKQDVAENGDRVVALLNRNEATLKTFYKENGRVRLQPANKNYQPIIVKNWQELALQGVLLDVIKTNETEQPAQTFVFPSKESSQQRGKITSYLNKVYNGDVMRVLKDLPDNSVDMIFGDPDYNVGIKYGENNYTKKFEDYINWYIELTKES